MAKVIKNRNGTNKADSLLISKSGLIIKANQGNDTVTLSVQRQEKLHYN